ncbi:hypothetical protein RJ035_004128 [Blastomyces gilchristii]
MEVHQKMQIAYDMASHHALGGGSYVFKSDYPGYLRSLLPHPEAHTEINIIIPPNSSPHVGTLCSLGLAFVVAMGMRDIGTEVMVVCDLWDRAKGDQMVISNITYQRSLRDTGKFQEYLPDYKELLATLSERYGIAYRIRLEEEFLKSDGVCGVIKNIIKDREYLGQFLAPATGSLASALHVLNAASSINTHGRFAYSVETDAHKFQFNCQLFNLVIGLYHERASYNYIEICGSDYAGFWQEQLLWRFLVKPILIVYTPLISDWSGSKVSKSLYLQQSAYDYLKKAGQEYLLNYRVFTQERKDLLVLWREIERWVNEPYRLFRGYSLHYLHLLFEKTELSLGIIHEPSLEPETE